MPYILFHGTNIVNSDDIIICIKKAVDNNISEKFSRLYMWCVPVAVLMCYLCRKNMNVKEIENILVDKGVRPTANRILVMRELMKSHHPVNLAELETSLYTMDRTSIFRVLELFAEKDIIHVIEDGSRSLKYELCRGKTQHSINDQHVHFYCEKCGKIYCFDNIAIPHVNIPESFNVKSVNFMIKGLCPGCDR